tara:strand:+ start:35 stop:454 length:420 start_codon:yes stop_codon:yes gene_type:complete
MQTKLNYNKWGIKHPLFQIDNKFKTSKNTPDGYYELPLVDIDNIDAGIVYIDPSHANYTHWKKICEDEDNLYVLSGLVQKTRYNQPKTTRDGWMIINGDSIPIIEEVHPANHMRKTIYDYVANKPKDYPPTDDSLWEYA